MKNTRKLRIYKKKSVTSDGSEIWPVKSSDGLYPPLECAYKDKPCKKICAHFNMSNKWKVGQPIFCGNVQMGVLG